MHAKRKQCSPGTIHASELHKLAAGSQDILPFAPFTAEMVDIKRFNYPINK